MPGHIQSVQRAAAILRLLAGGQRRVALGDVANALGLAKPTAHGLLRTLQEEGFVYQDPELGLYQLGPEVLRLGSSYLDVNDLRARSLMWCDGLARQTGEAVRIAVPHQGGALTIHHVFRPDGSHQVMEVGHMSPLHAGALGKVLLAFDPAAWHGMETELARYTDRTVTEHDRLEAQCSEIRERGWAGEIEESAIGLASIATVIRGARGVPLGAIGISGAIERLMDGDEFHPRLVAAVRDAGRAVSRDIAGAA